MTAIIVNEDGKVYAGFCWADMTLETNSRGALYFSRLAWSDPEGPIKVYATRQSAEKAMAKLRKFSSERMAVVS